MLELFLLPYISTTNFYIEVPKPPPAIVEEVEIEKPEIIFFEPPKWVLFSCVETAKWILGKQGEVFGNAWNIKSNKNEGPEIGNVVITNEGRANDGLPNGHIAVIVSKSGEFIGIREGNYKRGKKTERKLNINDPIIKGYKNYLKEPIN